VDWVKDTIAKNPLIEIGLRLIPSPAQPVLAILDVIQAVRSNSIGEAVSSLAKVVGGPAGQQLAQAAQGINIGSAVASGDIAGAATQAANAAGLKDVSAGIQTAKAAASGDISGAAQTAANAAGLKDVSAGIQTAKAATSGDMAGAADAAGLKNVATGIKGAEMVKALSETAEINRILQLSGLEFIAEDSTKSVTVQRGDTLSRIASDNGTTVDAIVKLNNIANPDRIYPGDVIKIPGGQGDPGGRMKRQGPSDDATKPNADRASNSNATGNAKIAMDFFTGQGWTLEQAAGLVANLQAESYDRLDPAALGDKGRGYGIAQWHGPRQQKFEEIIGVPLKGSSLEDQLKFVQWELTNSKSADRQAGNRLKAATTAAEAAAVVDEFYERSSGIHRQRRIAKANALLPTTA
jgi:LysM repeat protein